MNTDQSIKDPDEPLPRNKKRFFLGHVVFCLCFLISLSWTLSIILFGLVEFFRTAVESFPSLFTQSFAQLEHSHNDFLGGVLKGLECLFLAPLPMLLALAVHDLLIKAIDRRPAEVEVAHRELANLKTVIVGLMATALATDLLEKTVRPGSEKTALIQGNFLPAALLLLLLIGYVFVLDRHSRALRSA